MEQNNKTTQIIFEEEQTSRTINHFETKNSKIIELIIKYSGGIIKNREQANTFLTILVVIIMIIISLFLIFNNKGVPGKPDDIIIMPAIY